jgi:hypothetical protein
MSDIKLVRGAIRALRRLISAYKEAVAGQPNIPEDPTGKEVIEAQKDIPDELFYRFVDCVRALGRYASGRLDDLAVRYVGSPRTEWAAGLIRDIEKWRDGIPRASFLTGLYQRSGDLHLLLELIKNDAALSGSNRPSPQDRQSDAAAAGEQRERTGTPRGQGGPGQGTRAGVAPRSWTQSELDAAIREFKARRAPTYNELVSAVRRGGSGAAKSAQNIFGRNAVARALGVKAKAMVTKSEAWQEMARELNLPHGRRSRQGLDKARRVGAEIADDEAAETAGSTTFNAVINNETARLARQSLPPVEAEAILDQLSKGQIDDTQARELISAAAEQQRDAKRRKSPPAP